MRSHVSIASTLGLAAGLLVATAGAVAADEPGLRFESWVGAAAPAARAGAADQLVSATATFGTRVAGMPRPGARPDQTILPGAVLDVDYGYHWDTGVLLYTFEARPVSGGLRPDAAPVDYAGVGMGIFDAAGTCVVDTADIDDVSRSIPERLVYGAGDATTTPNAGRWDCAALFVQTADRTTTYDAYVSPLAVTAATPQLTLSAPRKDRLVSKVWTRIPVTVANASPEGIDARDVVVTGAGAGVKVRPASLGTLEGQDDTEGHVWARLTKPKANLELVVTEQGEAIGGSTVKLRRRPAPAPPKAGAWSSAGVDFTVRGGKVRGFRINTQTRCGGYPDIPTTTNNTYSFRTESIPRNSEVVGTERGGQGGDAAYSAYLEIEFVSRTKAKGTFSYYGPARCVAVDGFTVRLKR